MAVDLLIVDVVDVAVVLMVEGIEVVVVVVLVVVCSQGFALSQTPFWHDKVSSGDVGTKPAEHV